MRERVKKTLQSHNKWQNSNLHRARSSITKNSPLPLNLLNWSKTVNLGFSGTEERGLLYNLSLPESNNWLCRILNWSLSEVCFVREAVLSPLLDSMSWNSYKCMGKNPYLCFTDKDIESWKVDITFLSPQCCWTAELERKSGPIQLQS